MLSHDVENNGLNLYYDWRAEVFEECGDKLKFLLE
jgi:hypothetical protein